MDADTARDFIRKNHHAVLATYRADGSPQMSPVAADVDPDGMIVVSTRETAIKTKNLRRDGRASLCVLSDGFYGQWVLVDGRASLPAGTKRQYSSYCGNYTFDGGTLTTIVDASSDPARMGTAQVRKVRFEGDRMILVPPPTEAKCQEAVSGSTGKRKSKTPWSAIRSGCSSVSLPWLNPTRSPTWSSIPSPSRATSIPRPPTP